MALVTEFKSILDEVNLILKTQGSRNEKLGAIGELLANEVDHYDWVGFYFAEPDTRTLVLGPYTGNPTEHVRIPYGEGICGRAAETLETFVVQDVSKESNYLSCSVGVKSEIVVPIFKDGVFMGELDIDSHAVAPFSDEDKECLEQICALISQVL